MKTIIIFVAMRTVLVDIVRHVNDNGHRIGAVNWTSALPVGLDAYLERVESGVELTSLKPVEELFTVPMPHDDH
eukprot:1877350-Amphidinium_carterae.1